MQTQLLVLSKFLASDQQCNFIIQNDIIDIKRSTVEIEFHDYDTTDQEQFLFSRSDFSPIVLDKVCQITNNNQCIYSVQNLGIAQLNNFYARKKDNGMHMNDLRNHPNNMSRNNFQQIGYQLNNASKPSNLNMTYKFKNFFPFLFDKQDLVQFKNCYINFYVSNVNTIQQQVSVYDLEDTDGVVDVAQINFNPGKFGCLLNNIQTQPTHFTIRLNLKKVIPFEKLELPPFQLKYFQYYQNTASYYQKITGDNQISIKQTIWISIYKDFAIGDFINIQDPQEDVTQGKAIINDKQLLDFQNFYQSTSQFQSYQKENLRRNINCAIIDQKIQGDIFLSMNLNNATNIYFGVLFIN